MCRLSYCSAATRIVQSSDIRPQEFDAPRKQFAKVSQSYKEQWYPDDGIDYSESLSSLGNRIYVTVP